MDDKIKILFFNKNKTGVNYFRTLTPAVHLNKNYSNDFYIDINSDFDTTTDDGLEYMKKFNIVHYHTSLSPITSMMIKISNELKNNNVKLIMDIDDYWELDRNHPKFFLSKKNNLKSSILTNLKIADYVTTTTELFAKEIRKITGKDNVFVLPNAIDPEIMHQFENNKSNLYNGIVKIMYLGGSTHLKDLEQLEGVANMLNADNKTKGKFMFFNVGWDMRGEKREIIFNQNLRRELEKIGLWTQNNVKKIINSNGDISKLKFIPEYLINSFKNNIFVENKRGFKPDEIPYYYYEKIFTDNYKIIDDKDYLNWLKTYSNGYYPNETKYARRWTKPVNEYAYNLNDADVVIAPLLNTKFNNMKSPLKMVECWSRKIPVVCSDVPPYNIVGKHMYNCLLIPDKPNNKKYWYRELKKLILDENLRKEIGENLYNDFSKKYHLDVVNQKRVELYKNIIKDNLCC